MGLFDKFKNIFTKDKTEQKEIEVYDKGLEKTRKELFSKLDELNKKHKKITEEYFEELEEILIMADIGVNTVMTFVDKIRKRVKKENIIDSKDLIEIINPSIIPLDNEKIVCTEGCLSVPDFFV